MKNFFTNTIRGGKPSTTYHRYLNHGITPLSIEHAHVLNTVHLPQYHPDPFDRLIISQAIIENTPVLTSNEAFAKYDVEIIKT
jgi:PIN domain nuclease of toxin-antitoxin system